MLFIIMGGLPYLYADGKAYKCRFDDAGFTPSQEEVEITEEPTAVYSELEIKAQCQCLDSIGGAAVIQAEEPEEAHEDEAEEQAKQPEEAADPLEEMTLDELKEHAKQHDIKLGSARTKADIIAKITAAE
nr:MAG TPA: dimeris T4 recombination endonuclease VII [Caudoviricetes sp.]